MKRGLIASMLLATVVLAAPVRLVLVELPGSSAPALADRGFRVVEDLGDRALVRATDSELAGLAADHEFRVLDSDPEGKLYLFVMPRPGFTPEMLTGGGTVLAELEDGFIMRTDARGVAALNRQPVELARVADRVLTCRDRLDGAPPLPVVDDSLVQALVDRVNQDSVEQHIRRLVDFVTRYSTTDSGVAAVEWVRDELQAYGCDTTWLFPFRSGYAPNAVGVKYGTVNPGRIYAICGHVDNTSEIPETRAPGSDDNASGTSAVLEAARAFEGIDFENTVYFLGFSGEEQGLHGSDSFAEYCYRRGDSVLAVLNFDMISYGRQNIDTLEVIGKWSNPSCEWLVDFYIAQADTFTDLKPKKYMTNWAPYSDHHSFWERGYPAFCGIEEDFTPCYHTTGDTIGPLYYQDCGTNNLPMATEAIRAAVASLAKLAGAHVTTGVAEDAGRAPRVRIVRVEPSVGAAPFELSFAAPPGPEARVEVYDAAGRPVRTLDAAGTTRAYWDGRDRRGRAVATGIYLVRAFDESRSSTVKMVLTE